MAENREITLFSEPEELIAWAEVYDKQINPSIEDAALLLNYMEGHDYAIGMDAEGKIFAISAEKLELGYRTSVIKKAGYIVLEAKIRLKEGDQEAIRERMKELTIQRTTKQPLEYPSAGSTFKRPEGYFAGKLVMDSGLRGYQVGGARISEKHCGFVINAGDATAKDVRTLMDNVRDIVYEKYGVTLEPEVKFLGEFD